MGAKDLKDARERIKEFSLIGRANRIECPLLVGYSIDDRVMDPRGGAQSIRERRQLTGSIDGRWRRPWTKEI